ncbi:glycosyltransferase family 87 protein [Ruegeria sp. 6PALISEP08]|uniref:glycosyltransferase family 87 protein n=1 Tax=Ruegeria sp. 6PALISEP08 TaxID=1225660 RepID=UPI00067EC54C|nr:glycosyltransferase family 87 protein [Ruegeria sp. 6PALISEP08]
MAVFNGQRGWQVGTLAPAFVLALFVFFLGSAWYQLSLEGKQALNFDFKVFWSAGRLAYLGEPLAAFDVERLIDVHQAYKEGEWGPWLYPPAFLLAMQPLGALTFSQAWAVFSAISILALVLAVRPFSGGILPVWFAFALPPALLPSLYLGQTAALWTAGLLAALAALRDHRYVLAGIFIGLLTLKPQLGLLIPVALIACGAWRTIASAVITTIAISVFATLVFGAEYWLELREMMSVHADKIRDGIGSNPYMVSPYSLLASLGFGELFALILQWLITALAAIAVFLAWRSIKVGFDLRVAVLILGILLSTPYLWHYEAALLAMAALFLLRAGVLTQRPWGILLAAAMWIGVTPAFLFDAFRDSTVFSLRLLFFPILILACLVCLRALISELRRPSELSAHDEVFP